MESQVYFYILFWVGIFGLCFGSFFNVVILRTLNDESIVFPASKCPKCQTPLKLWHNIPVLSYLFLRGKCAFCQEKISIQYPLIEIITMGLFIFSFVRFGISWQALLAIIFCSSFLIMTMTDIKEKVVDCNIAIGVALVGILYNWLINQAVLDSIYGLLVGIVIMEVLARLGYVFSKDRAFGEADTYVVASIGAAFGLSSLLQILLYSLIASMIFIIPMFLYQQYKNDQKMTCIVFILFLLSAVFYKTVSQSILSSLIVILTALVLCVILLKNLYKTKTPTYLPLVPTLAIGALYYLFFVF